MLRRREEKRKEKNNDQNIILRCFKICNKNLLNNNEKKEKKHRNPNKQVLYKHFIFNEKRGDEGDFPDIDRLFFVAESND